MIYDSIPSKYAKLEKNFGGFIDRYMVWISESHHYIL